MKNRKLILLSIFGLVLCFCFGFIENDHPRITKTKRSTMVKDTTKGGVRIQTTNWSNTMGCTFDDDRCVGLAEDNILTAKLIVRVTDVNIADYPPMHFFYRFDGQSTPATAGFTSAITSVSPTTFENDSTGWEGGIEFEFDMDYVCDHIYNEPENKHFWFQAKYILVTPIDDSGGYTIYPVGDYPDLFSYDVFYVPSDGLADTMFIRKEICCFDEIFYCSDTATDPHMNSIMPDPIFIEDQRGNLLVDSDLSEEEDFKTTTDPYVSSIIPDLGFVEDQSGNLLIDSELLEQEGFKVAMFPNPFSTSMNIELENLSIENPMSLTVFDMFGQRVMSQTYYELEGNTKLDVSTEAWASGVYYFQFSTKEETKLVKSIKH